MNSSTLCLTGLEKSVKKQIDMSFNSVVKCEYNDFKGQSRLHRRSSLPLATTILSLIVLIEVELWGTNTEEPSMMALTKIFDQVIQIPQFLQYAKTKGDLQGFFFSPWLHLSLFLIYSTHFSANCATP